MLQVLAHNLNHRQRDLKLFEIGSAAFRENGTNHREEIRLAVAVCGRPEVRNWSCKAQDYDFYDLKGALQDFCDYLHLGEPCLTREGLPVLEPDIAFAVNLGGQRVGEMGEVAKRARALFDIDIPVYYLELRVDRLWPLCSAQIAYVPIPRFPSVWRDIAVVIDQGIFAEELIKAIRAAGGELLVKAELFDVYTGKQIEPNQKSLAFNLEFRSDGKTLTDEEVEPILRNIVTELEKKYHARLRT